MRQQRSSEHGFTLLEMVISTVVLTAVLGGAYMLMLSSQDLATSATNDQIALDRVDRALASAAKEVRWGSLASARKLDGTTFSDGDADNGFALRRVEGWSGTAVTGDLVQYQLVVPTGETEGELVRSEGGLQTVVARGLTGFQVARAGDLFTLTASSQSGPDDDRLRTATGSVQITARNP